MDHKAVKKTVAALVGATVIVGVLNFDSLSTDMVSCQYPATPPEALEMH